MNILVLNPAQKRILRLVLERGATNKEIAAEIGWGVQSVKNEMHVIYCFLGVTRSRELLPIIEKAKAAIQDQEILPK